ncbi:MAG: hypothetical protein RLZZ616_2320, partial [Pseudomonadota bacterium]
MSLQLDTRQTPPTATLSSEMRHATERLTASPSQLSSFANQANSVVVQSGETAHAGEEQVKHASQEVLRVTTAVNDSAKQVQGLFDDITRIS